MWFSFFFEKGVVRLINRLILLLYQVFVPSMRLVKLLAPQVLFGSKNFSKGPPAIGAVKVYFDVFELLQKHF